MQLLINIIKSIILRMLIRRLHKFTRVAKFNFSSESNPALERILESDDLSRTKMQ